MPTARKPNPLLRLERKVDKLAVAVESDQAATEANTRRLDSLNLNGSVKALHELADNADALVKLAPLARYIVGAVEERREREIAVRWLGRMLNPLASSAGKVIWTAFAALLGGLAWRAAGVIHFPPLH